MTMSEPTLTAPAAAAEDSELHALRWLPILHGAVTIIFGGLLLFTPGRTLAFVATLTGIWLCLFGALGVVRALVDRDAAGARRIAGVGVAVLAAAAGVVVIARPEGSIRTIAVVGGIYLIVMGVTVMVLGSPGVGRGFALLRGLLAVVAGVALVVWPDITVGVAAAIYGAVLLALGAAEVLFGLRLGRAHDSG
jgi:uncharacterized membrane protein HdeD (DUF308 family)